MERVVTRTIKSYEVEVLCLDTNSKETFTQKERVTQVFKTKEKLLNHLKSKIDTEIVKAIAVIEIGDESKQMYGMNESDFVKYGKAITKRSEV